MLRLAILENEEVAKELIFSFASILNQYEWSFQYFTKVSDLAKAAAQKKFQIIVFHEKFDIPRIHRAFVQENELGVVIYTKTVIDGPSSSERVMYILRDHIKEEIKRISHQIEVLMKNEDEYLFSYNNVKVPLKISDIYYIEKEDKNLVYYTKRGEFRERKSMKEAEEYFAAYYFLRIHTSYLLNLQYVIKVEGDLVYIKNKAFPLARKRKEYVYERIEAYTKR